MTSPYTTLAAGDAPASVDPLINALVSGYKWGNGLGTPVSLSYSFPWANSPSAVFAGHDGASYSTKNEPGATTTRALNTTEQQAVRQALQAWSSVANITFAETADTAADVGDFRFAYTSSEESAPSSNTWGWAYYPNRWYAQGGDVWISTLAKQTSSGSWQRGSSNFQGLLHEIGHALGLKHTFEGDVRLPASMESLQYSVQSYTAAPASWYFDVTVNANGSKSGLTYRIEPDTPQLLDIAAAQYLYGANMSYRAGDDVYTFDPAVPFMRTLWDAGGSDTISVSNFSRGCTIDLRAGQFSKISIPSDSTAGFTLQREPTYDGTNNLAIAYNVTIENAIGGAGDDSLIGNEAANRLEGRRGNDRLDGGAGIDTAVFSGTRAAFAVTKGANDLVVQGNVEGRDVLMSVERLRFSDLSLAFDIDGHAGDVAKLLGAVFGRDSLGNASLAGVGLRLLDGGMHFEQLMDGALGVLIGADNSAAVNLLYTNVVGHPPPAEVAATFADMIQKGTFTRGALGVLAAETSFNLDNIGFVELAGKGLPYIAV